MSLTFTPTRQRAFGATRIRNTMLITEALRRANSAHEIRFLLTNYIETLQFYLPGGAAMARVTRLPVHDLPDVEARWAVLRHARPTAATDAGWLSEIIDVITVAQARWRHLHEREQTPQPFSPNASPARPRGAGTPAFALV
jgi:hypothetical protein